MSLSSRRALPSAWNCLQAAAAAVSNRPLLPELIMHLWRTLGSDETDVRTESYLAGFVGALWALDSTLRSSLARHGLAEWLSSRLARWDGCLPERRYHLQPVLHARQQHCF